MFAVISPAKKLATEVDYQGPTTAIRFAKETRQLIQQLKTLSATQLGELMHISDALAQLNFERYQAFKPSQYTDKNAMPAVYLFQGDVYNDKIWNGIDENTSGEAKKGLYFYEITPIEYGDTRARTLVGVLFLDR